MSDKVLCVVSGGLDSITMAYDLRSKGWEVSTVSFDYGQRHRKELDYAVYHAGGNHWRHDIVDLHNLAGLLNSALTGYSSIPEGHYAAENMKATIVPNRNAILLSVACGIAVSRGARYIATAVHGGDHYIYPDCRPDFLTRLSAAFEMGNPNFKGIVAPYIDKDKNYIAQRAVYLDYDWRRTWSCYKGGDKHCGRCGTCVERMEALWSTHLHRDDMGHSVRRDFLFPENLYEDNTYWEQVTENA